MRLPGFPLGHELAQRSPRTGRAGPQVGRADLGPASMSVEKYPVRVLNIKETTDRKIKMKMKMKIKGRCRKMSSPLYKSHLLLLPAPNMTS
jgi:hypothetical protein